MLYKSEAHALDTLSTAEELSIKFNIFLFGSSRLEWSFVVWEFLKMEFFKGLAEVAKKIIKILTFVNFNPI